VETSIDLEKILEVAAPALQTQLDYEDLVKKFKNALITDFEAKI
jgi:hypothetical protein